MNKYVLIYAEREEQDGSFSVLTIEKDRPEWQKGRYNLLGGKIESGENPFDAAVRELKEEAGLSPIKDPEVLGAIAGSFGEVFCIRMDVENKNPEHQVGETEVVNWMKLDELLVSPKLIPNLVCLIPMMHCGAKDWVVFDDSPSGDVAFHTFEVSVKTR